MMNRSFEKSRMLACAVGMAIVLITPALSAPLNEAFQRKNESIEHAHTQKIRTVGQALAPTGFQIFCLFNATQCQGGGQTQIEMTNDLMDLLLRVNSGINRAIRPRNDKGDIWSINVSAGDCEDYVLTKRAELIKFGLPASALRIATAYTQNGQGHAVLVVISRQGDYVLDNRRNAIHDWQNVDLTWVAISQADPKKWSSIVPTKH
jgi:predicted transglutaminase-like cysteine proteinase